MKFVLATANPGKINEMREILSQLGFDIVTRRELGIDIDVAETGATFLENATLKARAICSVAGMPAIADDSGLCIDALGGAPGLDSSSFGGDSLDDEGRCEYLLDLMRDMEQRSAKFVSTIVCVFPDGRLLTAAGECRGEIAAVPGGSGGFGYDPVFIAEGTGKTMAELPPEEKNERSHRGKALRNFALLLSECTNIS